MKNNSQISASEFKKHFLTLVDEVKNKRTSFTITKRGTPVVRVIPLENNTTQGSRSFFGFMKGTVKISKRSGLPISPKNGLDSHTGFEGAVR